VGYLNAQISVPSSWFIEDPCCTCAAARPDSGRVFMGASTQIPSSLGCGEADNVVTIRPSRSTPIPHGHAAVVNGVPVEAGWVIRGRETTYLERGLGVDVGATGPLAGTVLRTLTHSPLSVVLNSRAVRAPGTWRQVTFGGLQFAVPAKWRTSTSTDWGGCPYNLEPAVLGLSTAQTLFIPGCPAPQTTAGSDAGVPGMIVGAGPQVRDEHLGGEHCLTRNALRICIYPPPRGFAIERGLQILTAMIYLPDQAHPDQIELGLSGSGRTPAEVFDSLKPAVL
jgi:hypothetical protein